MKNKPTIVSQKRMDILSNKEIIKEIIGIDETTYFWIKVDMGMAFLDLHFPRGGEYEKYYIESIKDPYFWAWWNLKWTNHEAKILRYFQELPEMYDKTEWLIEMNCIQDSREVNHSFHHNYVKTL